MGTYKNSYKQNEDSILWELHEIRNRLHKVIRNKSVEQINKDALNRLKKWSANDTKKAAI